MVRDFRLPGFVGSVFFLGAWVPALLGSRVPGFRFFWVPEFMGSPAPGTL